MLEDKFLVWKFNQRRPEALRRIYLKYKDDLLGLAISLTPDRATAEDVLHDVFVTLAGQAGRLELKSSTGDTRLMDFHRIPRGWQPS